MVEVDARLEMDNNNNSTFTLGNKDQINFKPAGLFASSVHVGMGTFKAGYGSTLKANGNVVVADGGDGTHAGTLWFPGDNTTAQTTNVILAASSQLELDGGTGSALPAIWIGYSAITGTPTLNTKALAVAVTGNVYLHGGEVNMCVKGDSPGTGDQIIVNYTSGTSDGTMSMSSNCKVDVQSYSGTPTSATQWTIFTYQGGWSGTACTLLPIIAWDWALGNPGSTAATIQQQ
jgi:hypothetical protein